MHNGNIGNRRQLPAAPSNDIYSMAESSSPLHPGGHVGESDLNAREPTPDYDTQSMASTVIPAEASKAKKAHRRSSADSNASTSNNKKRHDGASLSSSGGSTKDATGSSKQQRAINVDSHSKSKEKAKNVENGKLKLHTHIPQMHNASIFDVNRVMWL